MGNIQRDNTCVKLPLHINKNVLQLELSFVHLKINQDNTELAKDLNRFVQSGDLSFLQVVHVEKLMIVMVMVLHHKIDLAMLGEIDRDNHQEQLLILTVALEILLKRLEETLTIKTTVVLIHIQDHLNQIQDKIFSLNVKFIHQTLILMLYDNKIAMDIRKK